MHTCVKVKQSFLFIKVTFLCQSYLFFETMFLRININSVNPLSTCLDLLRYSFFSSFFFCYYLLISSRLFFTSSNAVMIFLYFFAPTKIFWLKYKNYRELSLSVLERSASFFPFLLSYYFSLPVSLRSAEKLIDLSQSPCTHYNFIILVLSRNPVRKIQSSNKHQSKTSAKTQTSLKYSVLSFTPPKVVT